MRFSAARLALLTVALLMTATQLASAQDGPVRASDMLTIGGGFTSGGSMLLDPAENWKVGPVFAWRATLDMSYPLTTTLGAWLSLGIDRRGGDLYWHDEPEIIERRMVNYFSMTPGINLKGIVLGLNIGFPIGGTRTYWNGGPTTERTLALDAEKDKLPVMIEPRIFGVIRAVNLEFGWAGVVLGAGYNVNDMSEIRDFMPGETIGVTHSSNTISLHVGVTFHAAIPGTAR